MREDTTCPLCTSQGRDFYKESYSICSSCDAVFKHKEFLLSGDDEKTRYEFHNNDVEDLGYQKFVSPITDAVLRDFTSLHVGLDFGCGTGPVISKMLMDKGFNILQYDPFFCDNKEALEQKYDYIVCCEVIEHFHNPKKEFELLRSLLKDGGKLYCKTELYNQNIDFAKWYYKEDDTHVFFYQEATFNKIKENFGFNSVEIDRRLIVFGV